VLDALFGNQKIFHIENISTNTGKIFAENNTKHVYLHSHQTDTSKHFQQCNNHPKLTNNHLITDVTGEQERIERKGFGGETDTGKLKLSPIQMPDTPSSTRHSTPDRQTVHSEPSTHMEEYGSWAN